MVHVGDLVVLSAVQRDFCRGTKTTQLMSTFMTESNSRGSSDLNVDDVFVVVELSDGRDPLNCALIRDSRGVQGVIHQTRLRVLWSAAKVR